MHSDHDRQGPASGRLMSSATGGVGGFAGRSDAVVSDLDDRALVCELVEVLRELLPASPAGADADLAGALRELLPASPAGTDPAGEPTAFDPDAAAVEIVTRGLDPELRAAVDADPHGTVLPRGGMTLAELDDLLASLVALAVHTATAAADRCGSTAEEIVAAAALRLRSP